VKFCRVVEGFPILRGSPYCGVGEGAQRPGSLFPLPLAPETLSPWTSKPHFQILSSIAMADYEMQRPSGRHGRNFDDRMCQLLIGPGKRKRLRRDGGDESDRERNRLRRDDDDDSNNDPFDDDSDRDDHSNPAQQLHRSSSHILPLLRCVESALGSGRFLRFSGITRHIFQQLDCRLDGRGRVTYFGEGGILLVKMAATEHEGAVVAEADSFRDQLVEMGLAACIARTGAPRINSIRPNTAAKEPDDGLIPILARPTGNHFPTLVF